MAKAKENRFENGWSLYENLQVKLVEADFKNDFFHFQVTGQHCALYDVYYEKGAWLCDCDDWLHRSPNCPGTFTCKHINACYFYMAMNWLKLMENKGG